MQSYIADKVKKSNIKEHTETMQRMVEEYQNERKAIEEEVRAES
jgi:hypothetical protein